MRPPGQAPVPTGEWSRQFMARPLRYRDAVLFRFRVGTVTPTGSGLTREADQIKVGTVESSARVSATTRSWNAGSRTCVEPIIGWPFSL